MNSPASNASSSQKGPGSPRASSGSIDFGRGTCTYLTAAERREWLVTNGIGGYASGTVAGVLTRRYHGLLIAALQPPRRRTLLLTKLNEIARYDGATYALSTNRWADETILPTGYTLLNRFRLDGSQPVWTFALADALLDKRVWMPRGANVTCIRYEVRRASAPLTLWLDALVNYRDEHTVTHANEWAMDITPVDAGLRVVPFEGARPLYLLSRDARCTPHHIWHRDFFLTREAVRGLDATEDHLNAGTFEVTLLPGHAVTLIASADGPNALDTPGYQDRRNADQLLFARSGLDAPPPSIRRLVLAADQFIARPGPTPDAAPPTVLAGYPWLHEETRNALIALPGLTLDTGRPHVAAELLRRFADHLDDGALPDLLPDTGEAPGAYAADTSLWLVEAVRATHLATGDDALLLDLFPALDGIVTAYRNGTRHAIYTDPEDHLLVVGPSNVPRTWMDGVAGARIVTPRFGKPIEANALWYNALRCMAGFARRLGTPAKAYDALADQVHEAFERYWDAASGYCLDVLDSPDAPDFSLRPNQLLAVSLPHSPLSPERQRAVVDQCARRLYTPHGLRSLAPDSPAYRGRYEGDPRQRSEARHQGTAWSWLIGPFIDAHLRVYRDPARARSYLAPLLHHTAEYGLGTIGELYDGDAPFRPRGRFADARAVAAVLRAWSRLNRAAVEPDAPSEPRSVAEADRSSL